MLVAGLFAAPAAAQGYGGPSSGPRQLFPQQETPGEEAGSASGDREADLWTDPFRDAPDAPKEVEDSSAPTEVLRLRGGIEVDRLNAGVPEFSGPLDRASGGLGIDLWNGSERGQILNLLETAPRQIESPVLRDLAVRLLLTGARPPSNNGGYEEPGALLRARVNFLKELGEHEALLQLLNSLPRGAESDPLLVRRHVEAALLMRRRAEACREVRASVGNFPEVAFWQEALIYCQISEGEEAAANLGLSLLREAGEGDPQIMALAEEALGLGDAPEPERADALTLAYLAALDEPPPPALIEQAAPGMLAALARQPRLEPELRLELSERAAEIGALSPEELGEVYARQRFPETELAAPLTYASQAEGAHGRALLYQAASRTSDSQERRRFLMAFTQAAATEGLDLVAQKLGGLLWQDLEPGPQHIEAAPFAVRGLILDGQLERAAGWVSLLRSSNASGFAEIWPLARAAGIENDTNLGVDAWLDDQAGRGGDGSLQQKAPLLRILIAALDRTPGEASHSYARAGQSGPPSPATLYALRDAAAAGRRGEAVLYSLQLAGDSPPGNVHPQALAESAGALSEVGLSMEARALAVESLVVQGF